jgi:hypothetical protein
MSEQPIGSRLTDRLRSVIVCSATMQMPTIFSRSCGMYAGEIGTMVHVDLLLIAKNQNLNRARIGRAAFGMSTRFEVVGRLAFCAEALEVAISTNHVHWHA